VHPEHKKNIQNLLSYFEDVKNHIDREVSDFLSNENHFSLTSFLAATSLLQKEIIREIFYRTNNKSTIGLSQ
jgi:protease II